MNFSRIKTIFLKDWKELIKSKQAIYPMLLVPMIFIVLLPTILIITSSASNISMFTSGNAEQFIRNFPVKLFPRAFDQKQQIVYAMIVYFFAPLFLIIPVMVSSIIASNSFAGEKERKTIEGLLYTPITDRELIIGKISVSFLPAIAISWICFLLYTLIVNLLGFRIFHYIFFPTLTWFLLVLWLVPIMSFLSLASIIAVSQKATSVWEAQQISALLLLPIIGLVVSQAAGLVYVSPLLVLLAGIVILGIDIIAYELIAKSFDREKIVTKLI